MKEDCCVLGECMGIIEDPDLDNGGGGRGAGGQRLFRAGTFEFKCD